MKICIRRGAKQIGGTCIEIESQGKRLVLDIGQPLDSPDAESVEMPRVKGLKTSDDSLLGVVLSHPHIDHYGLAFRVPPSTRFLMGTATERILEASAIFTPSGGTFENVTHLENGKTLPLGPFKITPYLMDHSAYDSYAVLVEGDGKRIFYTGDLREHGRKGSLFTRLVAHPPPSVDVLLMEGTTVSRKNSEKGFPTEKDLQKEFENIFRTTTGMPLIWCSGQNIDRLVTVFKAARRCRRQFVIDMYTAEILRATGSSKLPQADWEGISVFLPEFQKKRILRMGKASVANKYRPYRIFPEDLASASKNSVMLFRPSIQVDVEKAGCLDGACLVYSMWDGYLADEKIKLFLRWLQERGIPMYKCHTSGHASVRSLQRLRTAFAGAVVCPVHTIDPMAFPQLFENVRVLTDGEHFDINRS
jgi:ribonuclease J